MGNTELIYDYSAKVYQLEFDEFLLSKELIAAVKILIGSRALPKSDLVGILDKLPTARLVKQKGRTAVFEAEVYGDGVKMFLLSQGEWVKVLSPEHFAADMKDTLKKMLEKYE